MSRVLILCFIHGFKGHDDTFQNFPNDLKTVLSRKLPDHLVDSVVYPKYETKGDLSQATEAFLAWLGERVVDIRKTHSETPWPPNDSTVGVVLVAHSMGGFVAADALFLALNNRAASQEEEPHPLFPPIKGILAFDTPYNGLARSLFVYGAFSNYSKVSNIFSAMTALSAAAPAALRQLATRRTVGSAMSSTGQSSNPASKAWQLLAVRTGTVGAVAAGGAAAYMHRKAILRSIRSVKNLNRNSVVEGYNQGVESLGQGLAYINRGNVGRSFAWLSDHFTFVGALLKPNELSRRLERLGALKGVGVHNFYCSLGENGYWSGGYFVPERTFCAVPANDHSAYPMFSRYVTPQAEDEIQAHMGMFHPEKNPGYREMTEEAGELVMNWFLNDAAIVDDPKFRESRPEELAECDVVKETLGEEGAGTPLITTPEDGGTESLEPEDLPDISPIDIAAAASLVPPLDDTDGKGVAEGVGTMSADDDEKKTYMNHLFHVAQQAGTGIKGVWQSSLPTLPVSVSPTWNIAMPSVNIPSWKQPAAGSSATREGETEKGNGGADSVRG